MKFIVVQGTVALRIKQGVIQKFGNTLAKNQSYVNSDGEGEKFPMSATHHSIALTDVHAPENHVITGIRFDAPPIHLQIRVHKYNFFTGELEKGNGTWVSADKSPKLKHPVVNLLEPDFNAKKKVTYKNVENVEIEFQPTDWEEDIASHIVPYFDTGLPVNEDIPLAGVGMIYRSKVKEPKEAGFISPRIHKYNCLKLWDPMLVIEKDEKRWVDPDTMKSAIGTPMIVGIVAALVIGIGALSIVVTQKRKGQSRNVSKCMMNAPVPFPVQVNAPAPDKSSSDSSDSSESSDDESDSSPEDSDSSNERISKKSRK